MTVDAAYIAAISGGLFPSGSISSDTFTLYLAQATGEVEADMPATISTTHKDEAIAYLICHRVEAWKGLLDVNQENTGGDYSYGKKSNTVDSWTIAYDALKSRLTGKKAGRGSSVKATHSSVSSELQFDYQQIGA
jgi:hypothetical protein